MDTKTYAACPYINPYNGSPRRIRATPPSPVVKRKNTKILEQNQLMETSQIF